MKKSKKKILIVITLVLVIVAAISYLQSKSIEKIAPTSKADLETVYKEYSDLSD